MMIREEQPDDVPGIRKTVGASFPKPLEATAVDQLRADGDSIISLVAIEAGEVIVARAIASWINESYP